MTVEQYTALTGLPVNSSNLALITAQITRTQSILENLLGYSLDSTVIDDDQLHEIGKTQTECPCSNTVNIDSLNSPDSVIYAYRLFRYNHHDKFLSIDPATSIHKVKLVKDGVTYKTLNPKEYRNQYRNNLIKYLEQCNLWCACRDICSCVQLAVDADWFGKNGFPNDLMGVWADMVTYYSNTKYGIKSETLGPHSYTRFDNVPPEENDTNISIIAKYAGPNGSLYKTITV